MLGRLDGLSPSLRKSRLDTSQSIIPLLAPIADYHLRCDDCYYAYGIRQPDEEVVSAPAECQPAGDPHSASLRTTQGTAWESMSTCLTEVGKAAAPAFTSSTVGTQ